jgi:hypothetical protein
MKSVSLLSSLYIICTYMGHLQPAMPATPFKPL